MRTLEYRRGTCERAEVAGRKVLLSTLWQLHTTGRERRSDVADSAALRGPTTRREVGMATTFDVAISANVRVELDNDDLMDLVRNQVDNMSFGDLEDVEIEDINEAYL